jgi:ArsR family transcriptional regulator
MPATAIPPAARAALSAIAELHEACADPARLRLINLLAGGELCVCDLVALTGLSQPFVSRHLARLRRAEIVEVERRKTFAYYRLAELPAAAQSQLDAILESVVAADPALRRERKAAAVTAERRGAVPC